MAPLLIPRALQSIYLYSIEIIILYGVANKCQEHSGRNRRAGRADNGGCRVSGAWTGTSSPLGVQRRRKQPSELVRRVGGYNCKAGKSLQPQAPKSSVSRIS